MVIEKKKEDEFVCYFAVMDEDGVSIKCTVNEKTQGWVGLGGGKDRGKQASCWGTWEQHLPFTFSTI